MSDILTLSNVDSVGAESHAVAKLCSHGTSPSPVLRVVCQGCSLVSFTSDIGPVNLASPWPWLLGQAFPSQSSHLSPWL